MTSKEALERLIKDIYEQGKVISNNPNLMTLNVNVEWFVSILENSKQDLDRLEKFALENASLHTKLQSLHTENAELKDRLEKLEKVIEVWKKNIRIRIEPFEVYTYAKFSFEEYDIVSEVLGDE